MLRHANGPCLACDMTLSVGQVLEHVSDVSLMIADLCRLVRRGSKSSEEGGGAAQAAAAEEEGAEQRSQGALYLTTINRTPLSQLLGPARAHTYTHTHTMFT